MRVLFICFCWIVFTRSSHAQEIGAVDLIKTITGKFTYCKPDGLGNIFALTQNGQLKKYNAAIDSMGVFNDVRRYGRLHSISSGNALRTLLYFKEYRTVLMLDRLMQVVNKIDLRKSNVFQASLATLGYDNAIWIFDEQESRIKKLDEEGKLVLETADLRMVLGEAIRPDAMFDLGGNLYLYDPAKGLFIFDYYGGFNKKIALLDWAFVQPVGKNIVGVKEQKIMAYTPNSIDIKESNLGSLMMKAKNLYFTPSGYIHLDPSGIQIFEWKNKIP
jgi:hypothetical protein